MVSGEACVLGACCPLGIAAQVPGTDGRPGFASAGFPVSFAVLVCSCRAAGWGEGPAGLGGTGTPCLGTGTGVKSQPGSLDEGVLGSPGLSWEGITEGRMQPAPSVRGSLIWRSVAGTGRASGAGGASGDPGLALPQRWVQPAAAVARGGLQSTCLCARLGRDPGQLAPGVAAR